jgi:hypothetical protein
MSATQFFEASKSLKFLLVTSKNIDEAEGLLEQKFPNWCECSYGTKMEFLKKNFIFSLASRFTLEEEPDKIDKEDYFATLQYLISEARDFGIKSVVKN